MIVELGHFALVLALLVAALQCVAPAIGAERRDLTLLRIGDSAAAAQFVLVAIGFGALCYAFWTTDLSVTLVFQHSSIAKPYAYKIAGVWANHEGSMLLWSLMLALFGALVALFGNALPLTLRGRVLSVQGAVSLAFLSFVLFTSNPFERWPSGMGDAYIRDLIAAQRMLPGVEALLPQLSDMQGAALWEVYERYASAIRLPIDGRDLNPVLQDPGLALHPPILYIGYVGLSIAYSFAIAALWEGRVDAAWARWVRPWTLFAWMSLTLGIALGSYWAYYELGWGGWWFWDPVENASFMPWLAATALLHSAIVVEKRGELKSWTILLAITAFSFSLFGAFLVRSGVLASVHAFASDPTRGLFILLILIFFVGGALTLYARRAPVLASSGLFTWVSRESALLLNNVMLAAALAAVLVGTVAPLVFQAFGEQITVGPPFFNIMMALCFAPLLAVLPLGGAVPWKRGVAFSVAQRFLPAAAAAVIATVGAGFALASADNPASGSASTMVILLSGSLLGAWAALGALYEPLERAKFAAAARGQASWSEVWRRLRATPLSLIAKSLAHAGLGMFVLGAMLSHGLSSEDIRTAQVGERFEHGGVAFEVEAIEPVVGSNYQGLQAVVAIYDGGDRVATVTPERRRYDTRQETTTEVGLSNGLLRDFYVVLGERRSDGGWALRTEVKPLVSWIWLGCVVMSLGGLCSLLDRRLRVGAPSMRKAAAATAAALMLLVAAAPSPAIAIEPEEQFEDPAMEARARALFKDLRCMVCDNQSVDDSNAQIAVDIRGFARRLMAQGEEDAEIKRRLVAAYGEEILMTPPVLGRTLIVWLLPIVALIGAAVLAIRRLGGPATTSGPAEPPLSSEEKTKLDALLKQKRPIDEKDAKSFSAERD